MSVAHLVVMCQCVYLSVCTGWGLSGKGQSDSWSYICFTKDTNKHFLRQAYLSNVTKASRRHALMTFERERESD